MGILTLTLKNNAMEKEFVFKENRRKNNVIRNANRCDWCDANYIAKRSTSKYCSSSCRASAWKSKNEESIIESKSSIVKETEVTTSLDKQRKLHDELLSLHHGVCKEFRNDVFHYMYEIDDFPFMEILAEIKARKIYNLTKDDCDYIYEFMHGEGTFKKCTINKDIITKCFPTEK